MNAGKIPAYLKRFNSQKTESQGTDKLKAFNALKTKLRDAQSEFFKALGDVKQSQPDGLEEEYKFVALVKKGDGNLIMNETKNVPRLEGGLENKYLVSMKQKIELMKNEIDSATGIIIHQIRAFQEISDDDIEKTKTDFGDLLKKLEKFTETSVSFLIRTGAE